MKKFFFVLLLLTCLVSPALAQFHADFEQLDRNKDQKVTFEEFKAAFPQASKKDFLTIDVQNRGYFDQEEWLVFMNKEGMEKHEQTMPGGHKM